MDLLRNTPTKELMAAIIQAHLRGKVVIGIDTSPTGTGKTTSGAEFIHNLEKFLGPLDTTAHLKIVIIASQHRYLGNYWKPGMHEQAIRFLGAEEYARRVRTINNEVISATERETEMVKDGLIPQNCPLRGNDQWLQEMSNLAERKKINITHFREICRDHLQQKLMYTDPDKLFNPCNAACPLAGGEFFNIKMPDRKKRGRTAAFDSVHIESNGPRIALITSAKFKYRAGAFYEKDGEVRVRTADFQDISEAIIVFEEACDVIESLLSSNDEMASSTELLSDGAQIWEFFKKRQNQAEWVQLFFQMSSSLYLDKKDSSVVVSNTWVPINIHQLNPGRKSDFLLPVSRDRMSVVLADAPRYTVRKEGGDSGEPTFYRLLITDNLSTKALNRDYGVSIIKPVALNRPFGGQAAALEIVPPISSPLGSLVSAIFTRSIRPFVRYFYWTRNPSQAVPFRDYVGRAIYETLQVHSGVQKELRELATSRIDCGDPVKNLRHGGETFSEDYYYKHGIAYCEVHKPSSDATEEDPLKLTLNVSNAPPELLLYDLLKQGNSLLFSSASIKLRSPYTNANIEWLIRKHLGELAETSDKKDRIVIDMDDPRQGKLFRMKRDATNALFDSRDWDNNPITPKIFKINKDTESGDTEYIDAYQALLHEIKNLNTLGIPAIGIVLVNSYDHAKELLRRFSYQYDELHVGELYGINTDSNRPGLSILETWVKDGVQQHTATGKSSPIQDSMLFDEIERLVGRQMGTLLGKEAPSNGIVISVRKKIGKGSNFRNDLTGVKLGKAGRRYLGKGVKFVPENPFVDFNFIAWAEHPRNMVNMSNYRRIAVMGVSIGGREMQEKLTQKLKSGDFQSIQRMMKWSRFGVAGVVDNSLQELGRPVRCRTTLPAHRFALLSDTHARLFMLGMGHCRGEEILITPDIESLLRACTEYWIHSSVSCGGENNGAAQWVSDVYQSGKPPDVAELKAVRDIRSFLADINTHVMPKSEYEAKITRVLKEDYEHDKKSQKTRENALAKLRFSYIAVPYDLFCRAKVGGLHANSVILNHVDSDAASVATYRRKFPGKKQGQETVMILKPRELAELAYPACDEFAIRRALDQIVHSTVTSYTVKSSLDSTDFMGAIIDGTHEAGDFMINVGGLNLLLDAKTTALRSEHNPELRSQASIAKEVLNKVRRVEKAEHVKLDAFVFANSGWECQDMWYYDDIAECPIYVYHMDACTTMHENRMRVEFEKTLQGIVEHIRRRQESHDGLRA